MVGFLIHIFDFHSVRINILTLEKFGVQELLIDCHNGNNYMFNDL